MANILVCDDDKEIVEAITICHRRVIRFLKHITEEKQSRCYKRKISSFCSSIL